MLKLNIGGANVPPFEGSGETYVQIKWEEVDNTAHRINARALTRESHHELWELWETKCVDFRRVLSNAHISEFVFEGKRYKSVGHAYQAEKLRTCAKWYADEETRRKIEDWADEFTVESGSEYALCTDPASVSRAGGTKSMWDRAMEDEEEHMYGRKSLRTGGCLVHNPTFWADVWPKKRHEVMERVAMAKFVADEYAREMLLATWPSELHCNRSSHFNRLEYLERIRDDLTPRMGTEFVIRKKKTKT